MRHLFEVDGKLYQPVRESRRSSCEGCAFTPWSPQCEAVTGAFSCEVNGIVYEQVELHRHTFTTSGATPTQQTPSHPRLATQFDEWDAWDTNEPKHHEVKLTTEVVSISLAGAGSEQSRARDQMGSSEPIDSVNPGAQSDPADDSRPPEEVDEDEPEMDLSTAIDTIDWLEKGNAEWKACALSERRQARAARATARIAIAHLEAVLSKGRANAEQQAADEAARDWLESIGMGEERP